MGNIWRFPYLAQTHGGGTFLIPYFISLTFIGLPLVITELSLGQRLRRGAIDVYRKFHPAFMGLGIGMACVSFSVGAYYTMIAGWALFYLFNSFANPLPWSKCPTTVQQDVHVGVGKVWETIYDNITYPVPECALAGSANYFWYRTTLDISDDITDHGNGINTAMVSVLLLAWIIIFYSVMNGSEQAGSKLYFIALFPYVVLTIFLIMGLTREGGMEGLNILLSPDWDEIMNAQIWVDAAGQIFYSFGLCYGGIIAFSSYNPLTQD